MAMKNVTLGDGHTDNVRRTCEYSARILLEEIVRNKREDCPTIGISLRRRESRPLCKVSCLNPGEGVIYKMPGRYWIQ